MTPYNIIRNVSMPETHPIHTYLSGKSFERIVLTAPESLLMNVTPENGLRHHVEMGCSLYSVPKFKCDSDRNKVLAIELFDRKFHHRDRGKLIRSLVNTKDIVERLRRNGSDIHGINMRIIPMYVDCVGAIKSYCNTYGLKDISEQEVNEIRFANLRKTSPLVDRIIQEFDAVLESS